MLSMIFGILILLLRVVSAALLIYCLLSYIAPGQPGDGVSPSLHGGNPEPLPAASVQVVPQADEFLL